MHGGRRCIRNNRFVISGKRSQPCGAGAFFGTWESGKKGCFAIVFYQKVRYNERISSDREGEIAVSEIKLFEVGGVVKERTSSTVLLEKQLQTTIEQNMEFFSVFVF